MKRALVLAAALAAALPAALLAADVSFEGRWLLGGTPQASVEKTCTVRFYGSDAADATAATTVEGVPFKTDADGYFVVSAEVPAEMPDTFWVGVEPQGDGEIRPRLRVAPVPFALAAGEAALVKFSGPLAIDGEATVERLETTGDVSVDRLVVPPGGTLVTTNLQLSSMRVEGLSLSPSTPLGLLSAAGGDVSPDFDSFVGELLAAEVSLDSIFWLGTSAKASKSKWWTPDRDGFMLVALKATLGEKATCPEVTVAVGPTVVVNALPIGVGRGSATVVKRLVCVPVRAGERAEVLLVAKGAKYTLGETLAKYKPLIEARVRFVSFGRE